MKSKKSKEYLAALAGITALSNSFSPVIQAVGRQSDNDSSFSQQSTSEKDYLTERNPDSVLRSGSSGEINITGQAVGEGAGYGSFMVGRSDCGSSGTSVDSVSVDYVIEDGSAVKGQDYLGSSGTLTWGSSGDCSSRRIDVQVIDDSIYEADIEAVKATLFNVQGSSVGSSGAILSIYDDETRVQLSSYSEAAESDGYASVYAYRNGCHRYGITDTSVDYATNNVSAIAGEDYVASSGTLSWGSSGDCSVKQIAVPLIDDSIYEQDVEILEVNLYNPQGTTIGSSGAILGIRDNETRVNLLGPVAVGEGAGHATLYASRNRCYWSGIGASSIDYSTSDVSAVSGEDYTASKGTLSWGSSGDCAYKPITVPIIDDSVYEKDVEAVLVSLSNPQGTFIGSSGEANLYIWDNDPFNCAGLDVSIVNRYVGAGEAFSCLDAKSIDVASSYVGSSGTMILSGEKVSLRPPYQVYEGANLQVFSPGSAAGRNRTESRATIPDRHVEPKSIASASIRTKQPDNPEEDFSTLLRQYTGMEILGADHLSIASGSQKIVFTTPTQLLQQDRNSRSDVYLYDLNTGTLSLVSEGLIGPDSMHGNCRSPYIDDFGKYIVFQLLSENRRDSYLYRHDVENGTLEHVAILEGEYPETGGSSVPVIDSTGNNIYYERSLASGSRKVEHLRRNDEGWELMEDTFPALLRNDNEASPAVSGSGRYVAYLRYRAKLDDSSRELVVIDMEERLYTTTDLLDMDFWGVTAVGRFVGESISMEWMVYVDSTIQERITLRAPEPHIPYGIK